jgi:hydrogenase maturation protease
VTFLETSVGGLRLLDVLAGYERAILVDAIQTPGGQPGDLYWLRSSNLRASLHSGSTHDLSLPAALDLGRRLGMDLPGDGNLLLLAVEVEDVLSFGEHCTSAVNRAIHHAVEALLAELPV